MPPQDVGESGQEGKERHRLEPRIDADGGDVVRRDKVMGDVVYGDKVMGDKYEVTFIQKIFNFLQGDPEQQRAFRNRQNMLQLVWNTWIEGVLKKSLYNEVLIELGMETKPDAVEHPWDMVVQMPDKEPRQIAQGTTMLELFDQANGALLILGEPGSGKTTMLLELCRLTIERAEKDPQKPIPVVFNLSSWTDKGRFEDWLVGELNKRYRISNKLAQSWIENDSLTLLLDGLDEVKSEHQSACVEEINAFRNEHDSELAVCSRAVDYDALASQLELHDAIILKPLSGQQIDRFIERLTGNHDPLQDTLYQALHNYSELRELAQTPLMLSVMILTYQGLAAQNQELLGTQTLLRQHLFDAYIKHMFARKARRKVERYSTEQTLTYLQWLAKKMVDHGLAIFYLEEIGPSWLPDPAEQKRNDIVRVLVFGMIGGLILGTIAGLMLGPIAGLVGFLLTGSLWGFVFAVFIRARALLEEPSEKITWSWGNVRDKLKRYKRSWSILIPVILLTGLLIGMETGGDLVNGLYYMLFVILTATLFGVIVYGVGSATVTSRLKPGQGIWMSLKNGLVVGSLVGLGFWPVIWLISGISIVVRAEALDLSLRALIIQLNESMAILPLLLMLLLTFLATGLLTGLNTGLGFFISYMVLYLTFQRRGSIPWNYIDFLDYCTDRIFLRRVGGGYIFIHRMLMEHFAVMAQKAQESESSGDASASA